VLDDVAELALRQLRKFFASTEPTLISANTARTTPAAPPARACRTPSAASLRTLEGAPEIDSPRLSASCTSSRALSYSIVSGFSE
jgi:hypothetical protein